MSITDELRKWSWDWSATNRSLDKIADRIDKAHETAIEAAAREENTKVWAAIDDTHIELPKDKNGKVIHPGYKLINGKGRKFTSNNMGYTNYSKCWYAGDDPESQFWLDDTVEIIKPDTQEKIDADALSIADEWCDQSCDTSGSKQYLHGGIQDLLRRQRALDGVA